MGSPLEISVVIPAKNRAHTLRRCLDSILGQTCPVAEIIVVDDASTDGTVDVIKEYAGRGVVYTRLPAGAGAQAARNHGVRIARHDWIAFQDSDDLWLPRKVERQVEALDSRQFDKAVVVHGDATRRDEATGLEQPFPVPHTAGHCYRELLLRPSLMFQALFVSRDAIMKAGGLDDDCPSYQEWDTAIRLSRHCEFLHVQEPLFVWVWHAGDAISKDFRRDLAGYQYVIEKHREEIVAHHGTQGWRVLCMKNVVRALVHGNVNEARSMLKGESPHTSKALATVFARLGFLPPGGDRLLRLAAMLPL